MPKLKNNDSQDFECNQNDWSPIIEKKILQSIKSSSNKKTVGSNYKSEHKGLFLLVLMLILLSIGLWIQSHSIIQSLQEAAKTSVQQLMQDYKNDVFH